MKKILIPVPDNDFDTTEVSVPWKLLKEAGFKLVFATENGNVPKCDEKLLCGVIFGKLGADPEPVSFYRELEKSPEFNKPITWKNIKPSDYDGLLLPGGHAPGMKQYLASDVLQSKVAEFASLNRPIGAICHGVLVLARSKNKKTGESVLAGKKTTCLPKFMEQLAYYMTFWKLGKYYRTYPLYVEDEVKQTLGDPKKQFMRGPLTLGDRGTATNDKDAFVVEDGNYISARWPGDAYLFGRKFIGLLNGKKR
ncbi:MAG: type 1 glutamine amidotransferase domain-containing protein [Leptospira sp.]|nr:type 1 glutamine amidotransferase domain-containing protein [Leptospira sp.]